jgi:4-amino-4-deoxy-L-arabinose transferase-like glycosyltransferase
MHQPEHPSSPGELPQNAEQDSASKEQQTDSAQEPLPAPHADTDSIPIDANQDGPADTSASGNGLAGVAPPPPQAPAPITGAQVTRDRTSPPQQRGKLTAWLAMAGCLLLALCPLTVKLDQGDVVNDSEAQTVAMSAQTWKYLQQDLSRNNAFLSLPRPRYDGRFAVNAPPATTWLHLLAFKMDTADPLDVENMVADARLVSVAFALLTIAAVYWAGFSIGGVMPASFAALVCLANPLFVYYGRMGGPTMVQLGFAMLAMAAALWAIRPLRPSASLFRQALGWTISGLTLGMAIMALGPLALSLFILPLLVILLLCPHRISHLMGLTAALLIAALLITPWVGFIYTQNPELWQGWIGNTLPKNLQQLGAYSGTAGTRLLLMFAAVLPWTLWLVGALVQPFSTSSVGSRQRMFIGWAWFLCVSMLLLLVPVTSGVKEMMPLLPVAAVLIGQLFRQYSDMSAEGRYVRFWRTLRWPHLFLLLMVSIMMPLLLYGEPIPGRMQYISNTLAPAMPGSYWAGMGVALVLVTLLSMRLAIKHYPGRALVTWSAWTVIAMSTLTIPMVRGPLFHNPLKDDGLALGQVASTMPIYYLLDTVAAPLDDKPPAAPLEPALLLYAGGPVPTIRPDQLEQARAKQNQFSLLCPPDQEALPGFEPISQLPTLNLILWQTKADDPDIATMPLTTPGDTENPPLDVPLENASK